MSTWYYCFWSYAPKRGAQYIWQEKANTFGEALQARSIIHLNTCSPFIQRRPEQPKLVAQLLAEERLREKASAVIESFTDEQPRCIFVVDEDSRHAGSSA
jgi:hypothetical protein